MNGIGRFPLGVILLVALLFLHGGLPGEVAALDSWSIAPIQGEEGAYLLSMVLAREGEASELSLGWAEMEGLEILWTRLRPRSKGRDVLVELAFRPPAAGESALPELRLFWNGSELRIPPFSKAELGLEPGKEAPAPRRAEPGAMEALDAWRAALPPQARRAEILGRVSARLSWEGEGALVGELLSLRLVLEGRAAFLLAEDPRPRLSGPAAVGLTEFPPPLRLPAWEGELEGALGSLTFLWSFRPPAAGELSVEFEPYRAWDPATGQGEILRLGALRTVIAEAPPSAGARPRGEGLLWGMKALLGAALAALGCAVAAIVLTSSLSAWRRKGEKPISRGR